MRVFLVKDIKNLGKEGDIKEVKDGYAYNFLIKKDFAKIATKSIIEEWKEKQKKIQESLELKIKEFHKNKKKLENKKITIKKKLAPVGIQGSVGKEDIVKAIMSKFNIEIDKKRIELKKSIKTIGIHEVDIKLGQGISASIRVEVIGEE